ncbi:hypothetical protein B5M09_013679, partial [Aphanomyces astaci]
MKSIAYFAAAVLLLGSAVPASADDFHEINDVDDFNEANDLDDFHEVNDLDDLNEVNAWRFYSAQDYPLSEGNSNLFGNVKTHSSNDDLDEVNDLDDFNDLDEVNDLDDLNEVNDLDDFNKVNAWRFYSAQDYPLSESNSNLFANVKTHSSNDWWQYNIHTRQLQSRSNLNNCLDAYLKDGKYWVHTWPCRSTNGNQKWHVDFADHRIKHDTHPNVCLDADPTDPQRKVQVWECHPHDVNKNQYWSLNEETIHFKRNDLYLTNTEHGNTGDISFEWLLPEDTGDWNQDRDQEWDYNRDFHQVRSDDDDYCLDAYNGRVRTSRCSHTDENQKWQYDVYTNQLRHLTHNRSCLELNYEAGAQPHL